MNSEFQAKVGPRVHELENTAATEAVLDPNQTTHMASTFSEGEVERSKGGKKKSNAPVIRKVITRSCLNFVSL
uniref:Uncharacterized protein n=1 Tax=Nelumbo nucifera TaxID=4432 RepID=A0A822ZJS7_NELNU|nr:TPA_asm: hypothetical protein HUJ06_001849 [Nelumbo nucifera]